MQFNSITFSIAFTGTNFKNLSGLLKGASVFKKCALFTLFLFFGLPLSYGQTCVPINTVGISGYICDNNTSGVAYLSFGGSHPQTVELTQQGTNTTQTYTITTEPSFVITGLIPNAIYDVKATNACGQVNTTVAIVPFPAITLSNTEQPCEGNPYTVCVPEIAGASYSWTHDGVVIHKATACLPISS